ncbi:MAG: hypothetical protein R2799_09540 [Crocinitomicaceae bacterium]
MSIKSMISKYYAFGIISLLSIFAIYHPIVVYPLELFESANIANAQMRIFEFGELPVFDFMSSHMLYEQWTGWVYHLIHGYSNDFSFMAYFFLNEFIFLLILYFILKEIFNESLLALIAICCLPFLGDLFNSGLLIGILPVFFIKKLMEDPSIKNYLRFYGVLLFLFFWKIDVGVASTFASSFLLLILWMTGKVEFKIKQVLVSFLIVLVFLGLALGFSFLIRSPEYILGNLEAALHYIKASQAHGYSRIAHGFNQGFYFHYFLIPLFAVLLVLLSIIEFKKSRRGDRLSMTHLFGIFFILFFLGNFQRGLVRHSFMDGLDFYWSSYFFVGLVFYLIYWFGKEQKSRIIWIFFIGNVFLFLSFKEFNVSERTMMLERVVSIPSHLGFKAHLVESQYSNRVEIPEEVEKEYKHIVEYLKKELVSEETFYDFSNTPLLYFLTSKKQPSYFCQNLQNTVDDFLQLKQIGQLKNEKVPLLIYSNEPANFWDRTDDVDNSLRYYLLAEYFFQNYQPDTIVDNKWVWKENQNMRFRNKIDFKAIRHLNYGKSAAIWSEFLNGREDLLGEEYLMVPKIDDQGIHYILEMDPQLQRQTKAAFLSFEFDLSSEIYPEENIEWEVRLMHENTIIGSAQFKMFEKRERYIIRLSNFYNWYHVTVDSIELITKPEHLGRMQLKSVKIIKDKRFEG